MISHRNALNGLQQNALADLNRYALNLQQKLLRYKDIPRLLASHSALLNGLLDYPRSDAAMRANLYLEKVNRVLGSTDVYLMNSQGLTVAASNWNKPATFIGRNFSFRPYFQVAMGGKAGHYFALGTTSKKRGYYFSYPVSQGGEIIGVVVLKIQLNEIEQDWSDASTELLVSDEDGVVVISTRENWKFRTLTSLKRQDIERIAASRRYGNYPLTPLDITERRWRGQHAQLISIINDDGNKLRTSEYLLQSRSVPDTGLTVSILANADATSKQVNSTMLLLGSLYLAAVMVLVLVLARRKIQRERLRFEQRELQALEKSESQVRSIIDNTKAGLITLDAIGRIESMNPTALALFDYSDGQLKGRYLEVLLAPVDHSVCRRHLSEEPAELAGELAIEASGTRRDGSLVPIELTIGRMPAGASGCFIVTIHDITQRGGIRAAG